LQGIQWSAVVRYAIAACLLQLVVGTLLMLYRGRYKTASFDESLGLALSTVIVAGILGIFFLGFVGTSVFPRALAVLTPPVALLFMATGRWGYRTSVSRFGTRRDVEAKNVLIYGAGNAGHQLARLLTMEDAPFRPVGFIDDDKSRRHLRL